MVSERYERDKAYYLKNKIKIDEYRKNWRKQNRSRLLKNKKEEWVKFYSDPKNREKERKRNKLDRENNPKRNYEWVKNNPEKFKTIQKRYRRSWKGQIKFKKYHAERKALKYELTPEKLLKAFNKTNGICPYCSCKITKSSFSLDHRKPISKGGTNHLNNLIACCRSCNSRKGDSSLKNFKTRQNLNNPNASIIQVQVASRSK